MATSESEVVTMTHDELLEKIAHWNWIEPGAINALRAVVELHKPKNFIVKKDEVIEQWCTADNSYLVPYPCPTIQAIEKELM